MRKKNVKRFAALTMAAVMACGSGMTVFADSKAEGTGTYEGKDGEKPVIAITLPTDSELANVYDYKADPNNLIGTATSNGSLGSTATVETTHKGILFQTDTANTYGATSKKFEVTSENMQDVDITVDVKVKEAGDASIEYASTDTFEATDKAQKLYLAIVNGASGDAAKSAALTASGVKLTQTAAGATDNYELTYNTTDTKYVYTKKASPDTSKWNKVAFAMTGAINTNAEWGEGVKFPKLEVTWSYAEHTDEVEANGAVSGGTAWLSLDGTNGFSAAPTSVTKNGTALAASDYTYSSGWVSVSGVVSGDVIKLVVADTTYVYTAP